MTAVDIVYGTVFNNICTEAMEVDCQLGPAATSGTFGVEVMFNGANGKRTVAVLTSAGGKVSREVAVALSVVDKTSAGGKVSSEVAVTVVAVV